MQEREEASGTSEAHNEVQQREELSGTSETHDEVQQREEAPEAFHPAYTYYVVPPDPEQLPNRYPRAVHRAQPAPVSYALLRHQNFFVMKRSLDDPKRDNIVIGKANVYIYIYKITLFLSRKKCCR